MKMIKKTSLKNLNKSSQEYFELDFVLRFAHCFEYKTILIIESLKTLLRTAIMFEMIINISKIVVRRANRKLFIGF